jgi:hypothetical protein
MRRGGGGGKGWREGGGLGVRCAGAGAGCGDCTRRADLELRTGACTSHRVQSRRGLVHGLGGRGQDGFVVAFRV